MQVSARISYPDPDVARARFSIPRPRTGDPVLPVSRDERGSGYRGNLTRGSQQQVNDRESVRAADMEVFVARSLSSTLAMLQMHIIPESNMPSSPAPTEDASTQAMSTFLDDLFAGILSN